MHFLNHNDVLWLNEQHESVPIKCTIWNSLYERMLCFFIQVCTGFMTIGGCTGLWARKISNYLPYKTYHYQVKLIVPHLMLHTLYLYHTVKSGVWQKVGQSHWGEIQPALRDCVGNHKRTVTLLYLFCGYKWKKKIFFFYILTLLCFSFPLFHFLFSLPYKWKQKDICLCSGADMRKILQFWKICSHTNTFYPHTVVFCFFFSLSLNSVLHPFW